jgi:hypothetical protein
MAGMSIMKAAVQLTAVSIKLKAARTEIVYNGILSSVSESIIWFLSNMFNYKLFHSALNPTRHRDCKTRLKAIQRKKSNPQPEKKASLKLLILWLRRY